MSPPSLPPPGAGGGGLLAGLLRFLAGARPGADTQLIKKAYEVAEHWHRGQTRKSGDPYLTHPVAVAMILAETGADDQTLCAALLHDVMEDSPYTLAALRSEFGAEIADLVHGTMAFDPDAVAQLAAAGTEATAVAAATAATPDDRVLMIKLADQLHNMRTVRHLPRARQVQKSRQALDVLVPIARTLRIDTIRSELESLASATLQGRRPPPPTASGCMLAVTAALLPTATRARWREEWLGELHVLTTRRERLTFAVRIALGIGRMAITLYRPAAGLTRAFRRVLATRQRDR